MGLWTCPIILAVYMRQEESCAGGTLTLCGLMRVILGWSLGLQLQVSYSSSRLQRDMAHSEEEEVPTDQGDSSLPTWCPLHLHLS